jgi:hypothetical protein
MKVKFIPSLIVVALAALIAFSCYQYSSNLFKQAFTAGALISSLVVLFFMLAAQFNNQRTTINIKAISTLATIVNLLLLFLFSGAGSTQAAFVISLCFLMVIYLGLVYSIIQRSIS